MLSKKGMFARRKVTQTEKPHRLDEVYPYLLELFKNSYGWKANQ